MNQNVKVEDGKFICKICGKEFKSTLSIGGHMTGHSRTNKSLHKRHFICKICNKEFKTENAFSNNDDIYYKSLCEDCKNNCYTVNRNILANNKGLRKKYEGKLDILNDYKEILKDLTLPNGDCIYDYNEFEIKLLKKRLLKHNFRCEICNKRIIDIKDINIDHNHSTLQLRGILCMHCKRIYSDVLSHKDEVNKYLSDCKEKSFNDKYYKDLIAIHRSKEYQDALNANFNISTSN